jgi:hypothetical protein
MREFGRKVPIRSLQVIRLSRGGWLLLWLFSLTLNYPRVFVINNTEKGGVEMASPKRLIILAVMCSFAVMPLYPTDVFAEGIPEVIKSLKHIQKTLDDQVIPKLDQCTQCPERPKCTAGVPQTGQKAPFAVGDDGNLRKGVSWPSSRFTDNGNGTVTDKLTGLIWLRNANCFGEQTWADALNDCNNLQNGSCGLTDHSVYGDWRLPNIKELGSLLDLGLSAPALSPGYPFLNGIWSPGHGYWSSTTYLPDTDQAWFVEMYNGVTNAYSKGNTTLFWPVRDAK